MTKKYIAIQGLIIVAMLFMAETVVRYMGYAPGDLRPGWSNFRIVDSLIVYHDFYVDSTGILVADPATQRSPVNKHGFRAPEFEGLDTVKSKVLLIGDSFTWGLSATSLDSSFADLLAHKIKELVINTGIPIADPAQYDAIAKRYVPQLKPEKVVVMFYLGNDIMAVPRPIVPLRPIYYYTNAGAMMANDEGRFLGSAEEAYDHYTRQKFFLVHPSGVLEKIIAKSALLSRIYSLKYRWQERNDAESAISDMSVTGKYIYSIIDICKKNGSALQIILIPEVKEADKEVEFFRKRYAGFFQDSIIAPYIYIPAGNSQANYVPYPDGHFNNAGHHFYADKIAEKIQGMSGEK